MTFDWLGGGLIVAIAAGLWLIYLVPTWLRRNEYLATERNALRLQQTLRILAETAEVPHEVRVEAKAKSVLEQQRRLKKVVQKQKAAPVQPVSKRRKARAITSAFLVLSLGLVALGVAQILLSGIWFVLPCGVVSLFLCFTRLRALARAARPIRSASAGVVREDLPNYSSGFEHTTQQEHQLDAAVNASNVSSPSWEPIPLPAPLYQNRRRVLPAHSTIAVSPPSLSEAEQSLRLASIESEQALRLAQSAIPDIAANPFSAMGVVDEKEATAFDLDSVLARRRVG